MESSKLSESRHMDCVRRHIKRAMSGNEKWAQDGASIGSSSSRRASPFRKNGRNPEDGADKLSRVPPRANVVHRTLATSESRRLEQTGTGCESPVKRVVTRPSRGFSRQIRTHVLQTVIFIPACCLGRRASPCAAKGVARATVRVQRRITFDRSAASGLEGARREDLRSSH